MKFEAGGGRPQMWPELASQSCESGENQCRRRFVRYLVLAKLAAGCFYQCICIGAATPLLSVPLHLRVHLAPRTVCRFGHRGCQSCLHIYCAASVYTILFV